MDDIVTLVIAVVTGGLIAVMVHGIWQLAVVYI